MRRCLILIGLLAVAPPSAADAETLASQSFVCNNKATWERIGSVKNSNAACPDPHRLAYSTRMQNGATPLRSQGRVPLAAVRNAGGP